MKKFYVLPLILLLWAQTTNAQYTKLLDFSGHPGQYPGWPEEGLLSDHEYLYGVTGGGGLYNAGTIYRIKIADGSFTNLYDFKESDGAAPEGTPVSDGVYLYGMTTSRGLYNNGTIYKLKIADNSFTVLHHFNGADGARGNGSLIIVDGYLYGMTKRGGADGVGHVFKLKIADNSFTSIYDLDENSGYMPDGSLVSDGTYLYGITWNGGLNDYGTIFKIKISDNSFTVMHNFNWDDGAYSSGTLIIVGSNLYGMAVDGGPNDYGNIFKIKIADGSFTNLYEFNGTDGNNPFGSLVSDGTYLYGMATNGGVTDNGTIFKMKIADNSVTKLHDFSGTDGDSPYGSLTIEGPNLYGTTKYGGTGSGIGKGVVFKYQYTDIYPDENNNIYVDSSAAPGGDGSSWATAIPTLSDALHYARTYAASWASDSLRIYVAKGTYLPEYRADNSSLAVNDRNAAFVMVKNVQLFGGFPNGGGVRNWSANPTILSGDIGTENDASDNAYHVVISAGEAGNALLNGFTITKGNATGSVSIIVNSRSVLANRGGGILNNLSSPALTNVMISGNTADYGGGIFNKSSNLALTNATISGNTASSRGGGMYNSASANPTLTNVTISGNAASDNGGGMYNLEASLNINNSILFGNTASTGNNIVNNYPSTATFKYSLTEGSGGWDSSWGTDGGNNVITATNPFIDNTTANYQMVVSSPAINAGSNQLYTAAGGNDRDMAGNARVYNQTGGGIIDMGAYEFQGNPVRPDANGFMYVDSAAAPGGDGSSWATALPQLADALKAAGEINSATPGMVKVILVASGTYYPLYTPEPNMTERDKTFMLVKDVVVVGGFTSTVTDPNQTAETTSRGTILSGDIGVRGNTSDNAYHVVTAIGDIEDASRSYFAFGNVTITGGNANGASSVPIKGRNILRNQGGGIESYFAVIQITNCLFEGNNAVDGAAIMNAYSAGLIANCTFADNADNAGKAIYNYTGEPFRVENCIVMDGIRYEGPQPAVSYSLVQGMPEDAASHNLDGNTNPYFKNAATDDYRLAVNSPAINAGSSSLNSTTTDLVNNPRVFGAAIDMGAYEFQGNPVRPDANGNLFVDSAAAPGGDGSSWAAAIPELADALHYARVNPANWGSDRLHIYVAKGTYLPKYRADDSSLAVNDRNAAFVMVKNVLLLGGFSSGGAVRNWAANPTVLSGDIGTANDASDNAYHVVISAGEVGFAWLGGFTITGGNATGSGTITVNGQTAEVIAGGGLYTLASGLSLSYVRISGNRAQSGGGIYNNASSLSVTNSIISGNTASTTGGGIRLFNGRAVYLTNVTISGNRADYGGGIANVGSNFIRADNSILFGNSAATGNNIYNSTINGVEFQFSLMEGSSGWNSIWGTDRGNNIITATNPFADTAIGNYQLVVSSPAINAGSNQLYTYAGGSDKDMAVNARVYNGGIIDMGAYEFQGNPVRPDANRILYVDSAAAPGGDGSSWAAALPELADALKAADEINSSAPGMVEQIWITSGTYYPLYTPEPNMTERDKTFMLVKNVALYGGFKGTEASAQDRSVLTGSGTILSGDIGERGNKADNAYHVVSAVDEGVSTSYILAYVTITGGNANGTATALIKGRNVFRNQGGGIEAYHANIRLSNCLLVDNSAEQGAAIMAAYGDVSSQVVNCTFSSNTDNSGKAIFSYQPAGALRIRNSIVMDGIQYNGQAPLVVSSLVQGMDASSIDHLLDGNSAPQFKDAAGGNYRLAANSPAINTGDNSLINSAFDLDNNLRVYDSNNGGIVDLGAYEFQGNPIQPDANRVLYVDSAAAPGGDGSSWATALPQLADALKAAGEINSSTPGMVEQIWITSGTYYPLYTPEPTMTERDKTFMLVKNVLVLGGFAGTETDPTQRTPLTGRGTILSGDIGVRGNTSDNAYHVVAAIADIEDPSIPRFAFGHVTITGGNADGTSTVQIKGRTVYRNEGGGLVSRFVNPVLLNCLFEGNNAVNGAAIMNAYGTGLIINCTFADNAGKAIYDYNNEAPLQVKNSIVMGGITYEGPQPEIDHSLVQGMPADITNHNLDGSTNPGFSNPSNGDYRLANFSPLINAGHSVPSLFMSAMSVDLGGYPRTYDAANGGIIDMGAYEYQEACPNILIAEQPLERTVCFGTETSFSLEANGGDLTYQWQFSSDGGTSFTDLEENTVYSGVATATLTIAAAASESAGLYRCMISNECSSLESDAAALGVTLIEITGTAPEGTVNVAYNFAFSVSGGTAPYTWSVSEGELPEWLALNTETGEISGTPEDAGAFEFTLQVENASGCSATLAVNLTIAPGEAPVIIFPELEEVIYGSADFAPGASASGDNEVEYVSSNENVVVITSDGLIQIIGAGTTEITASLPEDPNYEDALPVTRELVVNSATLTVTANDDSRTFDGTPYSGGNGVTVTGWQYDDTDALLESTLSYNGSSQGAAAVGQYEIIPSGYTPLNNYTFGYQPGILTIIPAGSVVINFPALEDVIYGGTDVNPGASSSDSREVEYTSSDPDVAIITTSGLIQIVGVGTTEITASLPEDPNYEDAEPVTRELVVNPATLIVTANDDSKTYDGSVYSGGNGVMVTGWQYDDTDALLGGTLTYAGNSQGATAMGTYEIIPSGFDPLGNYSFDYQTGILMIIPAGSAVINFPALEEVTYGAADFNPGATSSDGRQMKYASSDENVARITSDGLIQIIGAGTADITASLPEDPNYEDALPVTQELLVNPVKLIITADDDSKTYDGVAYSGGNGVTITGWQYDDTETLIEGSIMYSGDSQGATVVGTYEITPSGYEELDNYVFDYQPGTLTIVPAGQVVINFPQPDPMVYGAPDFYPAASSTDDRSVQYSSSNKTVAIITPDGLIQIIGAGITEITASLPEDPNYEDALPVTQELKVNPAALSITANGDSRTFDGTPYSGGNGITITGWQYDDTDALLTGTVSYSGNSQGAISVGTYQIIPEGFEPLNNYTFDYQPGTLSIIPAGNVVINFPELEDIVYGLADFAPGASASNDSEVEYTSSDENVAVITSAGEIQIIGAGTTEITASLAINPNYENADPVTRVLVVNPATLTITAADDLKPYDGAGYNGGNGVTVTGWQYDDTDNLLAGILSYGGSSQGAINAGQYEIIPSGFETLNNYVFNYQPGTLIITPAEEAVITFPPLEVDDLVYGDPGFTPGGGSSDDRPVKYTSSDETVVIITPDGEIQIVGTGPVTITASLPDDLNYEDVPPVSQELIIKPATLTIAAVDDTKVYDGVAYSGGNGVVATGWQYDDTDALLEGTLSYSGSSQGAVNTGEYVLVPDGYSAANYEIVYESGTLRIDKASLVVTAVDKTRKFGQENPEFTFNYQGFVSGEKEDDLAALPTAATTATEASPTGIYPITPSGAASENYQISYVAGTLTIIPATRLLVFDELPEKTYEDADFDPGAEAHPEETILYSSSNTAVAEIVDGMVHITGAGKTVITATLAENPNYENRPSVSRELIVHKAPQTIDFFLPGEVERDAGIIALDVSTSSGLPVTLSSSDEQVAIVAGAAGENQLEILRLGTSFITAVQPGNANYLPAEPVSRQLRVVDLAGNLIKVHQVVSPNSDGINEFLLVEGIRDYPENKLTIVTRNGVKVFEMNRYDNGANSFRGLANTVTNYDFLPQGTYFYLLEFKTGGQWKRKTGWFVMKYSNN